MEEIDKQDNPIIGSVLNYLTQNTSGALLVTGDWGCGKTHFFKNDLFEKIKEVKVKKEEKNEKYNPIMVSLFGINDLKEVPERVLCAYLDKIGNKVGYGKIAKWFKKIASTIPKIEEYVNIDKLLSSGDGLYRIIPKNILICFDDIERAVKVLDINKILGMINELVENKGYKVIIVANENFIDKEELIFKEKVIEKTLKFIPDIKTVFKILVDTYGNHKFSVFMDRELIINSIDPHKNTANKHMTTELKRNLSNIRILKFAIEHFYSVFQNQISSIEGDIDPLITKKLINYWVFILATSVEYKTNKLSFEDNNSLDSYQEIAKYEIDLGDDNIVGFEDDEEEEEKKKKTEEKASLDNKYSSYFFKTYFLRISENPIYHAELYNYVTAGMKIDYSKLDDNANKKLSIVDNTIDPAHELLDQFLRIGWWTFSNEQCKVNVENLLDYVRNGKLNDYVSYLNASTYIVYLKELLGIEDVEITNTIKTGIDKLTQRVNPNYFVKMNVTMIKSSLSPEVMPIYDYIIESIDQKMTTESETEKNRIEGLFKTNIKDFVREFLPKESSPKGFSSSPQYSNIPILKDINKEDIKNRVQNLEPNDAMCLRTLIDERYIKCPYLDKIKEEVVFLKALKDGISEVGYTEKKASNIVIRNFLSPILEKAIKSIE